MNNLKNKLRKEILAIRDELNYNTVMDAEQKILEQLTRWDPYNSAEYVMVYADFRNEIRTHGIMQHLLSNKKKLIVPLTQKENIDILPIQIQSLNDLTPGHFGLSEPNAKINQPFDSELLDLILIPGIVFDLSGNRIGFGKGYYDHFLSHLKNEIPYVALAYDFQVLDVIPHEKHDIQMDHILTPTRIINAKDNR